MNVEEAFVNEEHEIQFDAATLEYLEAVKAWVLNNDGEVTKTQSEDIPYYDTKNNRLIREGLECRLKQKKKTFRTDLKTPLNTNNTMSLPNERGIISRNEISIHSDKKEISVSQLQNLAILQPIQNRVSDIFNKQLYMKFRTNFAKTKINRSIFKGENLLGTVEYNLQQGHISTPDGNRKSKDLFIIELELKDGEEEALFEAIREFENKFSDIKRLAEPKVLIGFKLIKPDMDAKALRKFEELERKIANYDDDEEFQYSIGDYEDADVMLSVSRDMCDF